MKAIPIILVILAIAIATFMFLAIRYDRDAKKESMYHHPMAILFTILSISFALIGAGLSYSVGNPSKQEVFPVIYLVEIVVFCFMFFQSKNTLKKHPKNSSFILLLFFIPAFLLSSCGNSKSKSSDGMTIFIEKTKTYKGAILPQQPVILVFHIENGESSGGLLVPADTTGDNVSDIYISVIDTSYLSYLNQVYSLEVSERPGKISVTYTFGKNNLSDGDFFSAGRIIKSMCIEKLKSPSKEKSKINQI